MRSNLFLFLAQTRLFWKARAAISHLVFFSHRILLGIRHRVQEESTKTRSLLSLLRFVLGDLFVAILIAFGLQITNPYFVPLFTDMGFTLPKKPSENSGFHPFCEEKSPDSSTSHPMKNARRTDRLDDP